MKSRALGAIVLAGSTTLAAAQMLAFQSTGAMVRDLQEQSILPTVIPPNPLQPTGFPEESDSGRFGKVPEAQSDDKSFQIIRSGTSVQSGDDVAMSGGAEFMYKGYHIFADTVEGNLSTHIFSLGGEVKIIGKDAIVLGKRVTVDFDKKIYHASDSQADLRPSLIGGGIVQKDLYSHGLESFGSSNENQTFFGGITSCDLLHPHYEIDGDNIIVRPGKRAIFRKARIKLFGRTILKIPYLVIPLDNRSYNNLPIVGQSPVEGYYIKWRYGMPLPGDQILYTRLDYMSNLGVGLGATYVYKNRTIDGNLEVYKIEGPGDMLKIADTHKQAFKWGSLEVDTDYEDNNYLVQPGSTLQSVKTILTFPGSNNALTKLSLTENGSDTNGYSTENEDIGIADQRKLTKNITSTLDVDYQSTGSTFQGANGPTTSTTENLDVKEDVSDDLKQATADLQYQRQIPIGSTQAVYGSNDQTPALTLSSDSQRLLGTKDPNWPFKISAAIGQFSDSFGTGDITRDAFDLKFQHPDKSLGLWHSDISGEFMQGIYSDNTAEYVLNFADTESYRVGTNVTANFHYNYLRPYGYSPLAVDTTGQTNLATADLSLKPTKSLEVGAQSGFDLLRLQTSDVAWQPFGVRMSYIPHDWLQVRAQSTYDTYQNAWSSTRLDVAYKPGATFVSLGAYYDGVNHTWSNINLFLDGLKMGKVKLSAILAWDGFTNQFDNQQYSIIYDLHCAEAVFTMQDQQTGFMPGRTFSFMIRLKAFPFDVPFGAGSRGQPLGTGTGSSY